MMKTEERVGGEGGGEEELDLYGGSEEKMEEREILGVEEEGGKEEGDLFEAALTETTIPHHNSSASKERNGNTSDHASESNSWTGLEEKGGGGGYGYRGRGGRKFFCYLGNLTWWTTDRDVITVLDGSGVGDLVDVKFYENRANGQSKGYALLVFSSEASVALATERLSQKELHGQQLVVLPYTKSSLAQLDSATGKKEEKPPGKMGERGKSQPPHQHPQNEPKTQNFMGTIRLGSGPPNRPGPGPHRMGPPGPGPGPGPCPGGPRLGPPNDSRCGPPPGMMMGPNNGPPMNRGPPPNMMNQPNRQPPNMMGPPGMGGPPPPHMVPQQQQPRFGPPQQMGPQPHFTQQPPPGFIPQLNQPIVHNPGLRLGPPPSSPQLQMSQSIPNMAAPPPGAHINPNFYPSISAGTPPQPQPVVHVQQPLATQQQQIILQHLAQAHPHQQPQQQHHMKQESLSNDEFEEIMNRNRTVASSAISRAVSDAAAGDFASSIETLVTAVSLIRQSRVAHDDRCKVLVTSLQDTLHGIEAKSYARRTGKDRRERSRSPPRERSNKRHRRNSRSRSRSRERYEAVPNERHPAATRRY